MQVIPLIAAGGLGFLIYRSCKGDPINVVVEKAVIAKGDARLTDQQITEIKRFPERLSMQDGLFKFKRRLYKPRKGDLDTIRGITPQF